MSTGNKVKAVLEKEKKRKKTKQNKTKQRQQKKKTGDFNPHLDN